MDTVHPAGTAEATVTEMSRLFNAGDGAAAMRLFHPDITVEQPASLPHGGLYQGPDGLAKMGAAFARYWERTIENPRIFGAATQAVMLTTQTWTAVTTRRAATVDVIELFTVTDGQITSIRVFQQDTHLLLETLQPQSQPQPQTPYWV